MSQFSFDPQAIQLCVKEVPYLIRKTMQISVHRNRKNVGLICLGLVAILILFSSGSKRYEIEAIIKNAKAEDVWNYVADFSKMRILNPTM